METPSRINSVPNKPQEKFSLESINLALSQMQTKAYKERFDELGIVLKTADFYLKVGLKTDNTGSLKSVNRAFNLNLRIADISYSGSKEEYRATAAKNNALVAILRWHLENISKPEESKSKQKTVEDPLKSLDKFKSQIQQKIAKFQERIDDVLDKEGKNPGTYTKNLIEDMKRLDILFKGLVIKVNREIDPKRLDNYAAMLDYEDNLISLYGKVESKARVETVSAIQGSYSVDAEGKITLTDSKGNIFIYTVVKPQDITLYAANSSVNAAVLVTDGVAKGLMKQDANGNWRTAGFDGKTSIWDSYDVTFGSKIEIKKKFVPGATVIKEVSRQKRSPEDFHGVLQYGSAEWKEWAESVSLKNFDSLLMAADEIGLSDAEHLKEEIGTGLTIISIEGGNWCQPCNRIKPFMEEAEKKYTGKIKFVHPFVVGGAGSVIPYLLEHAYGVKSFPTFLIFKNGKLLEKIDDVRTFGVSGTQTAVDLDKTRQLLRAKLDSL